MEPTMDPTMEPTVERTVEHDDGAPQRFTCPRCTAATEAQFYGPCPTCRAQLVASQAGRARAAESTRFEPAMHVVPNQVATKD